MQTLKNHTIGITCKECVINTSRAHTTFFFCSPKYKTDSAIWCVGARRPRPIGAVPKVHAHLRSYLLDGPSFLAPGRPFPEKPKCRPRLLSAAQLLFGTRATWAPWAPHPGRSHCFTSADHGHGVASECGPSSRETVTPESELEATSEPLLRRVRFTGAQEATWELVSPAVAGLSP